VSDNLRKRTTSHAKTVDGLVHEESALDRARALKEEFNRDKPAPEHSRAREHDKDQQSEKAVDLAHSPRPEPHLRPEGPIRREVDRQIDKEKLEKLNQRAKELSKACKEDDERHKSLDLAHDWQKTRHHSR
jgi:hypothetical protein